jgi:hypothetical protein
MTDIADVLDRAAKVSEREPHLSASVVVWEATIGTSAERVAQYEAAYALAAPSEPLADRLRCLASSLRSEGRADG